MPRNFKKGKEYVFTKKKYIRDIGKKSYKGLSKVWVNKCNGRVVDVYSLQMGVIYGFVINPVWCKEVKGMGKDNPKELKKLLAEANVLIDEIYRENKDLKKKNAELEESCENFVEVERNLLKRIAELEKGRTQSIGRKLLNFLGV